MKPRSAKKRFLSDIKQAGRKLTSLVPLEGIDLMLNFYWEERAEGCSVEADGDMLLYQWGTYDWGSGQFFQFNITRQFIENDDEDDHTIMQLSLTFKFAPTDALRELTNGNRWCHSPDNLEEFRTFILSSPAFATVGQHRAASVSLEFNDV
jgi:hypothetical protein